MVRMKEKLAELCREERDSESWAVKRWKPWKMILLVRCWVAQALGVQSMSGMRSSISRMERLVRNRGQFVYYRIDYELCMV